MGAIERYSFKRVKTNGGYKYYVNGIEVSQTEYNRKSAEAKEKTEAFKKAQKEGLESAKTRREELLESRPKTIEERKKPKKLTQGLLRRNTLKEYSNGITWFIKENSELSGTHSG